MNMKTIIFYYILEISGVLLGLAWGYVLWGMKKDKKNEDSLTEGDMKSNQKNVTTPRPNIVPPPQPKCGVCGGNVKIEYFPLNGIEFNGKIVLACDKCYKIQEEKKDA